MTSTVEEKFSSYYEGWLKTLETHLQNLVMERQPNYNTIVASLTTHHKDYYTAKWALAHDDILAFFSPTTWLSPLESSFNWVTGWKPTTAFRLVDSLRLTRAPLTSLAQLTEDQAHKIGDLRVKIKSEEGKVERELERQQVALGDRNLSHMAQVAGRRGVNELSQEGTGVKRILDGLEKVMKMADYVRIKTLKGVLDVLSPKQGVDFLAVFAMLQLQMRKWGKQRNDIASTSTSTGTTTGTGTATGTGMSLVTTLII